MTRYLVPVHFTPGNAFYAIWGASASLPMVRDRPEQVPAPGMPVAKPWMWLIDVFDDRAGDPATFDRLILALAARWRVDPGYVAHQIQANGGVYVLACECWNPWVPVPCADRDGHPSAN